MESFNERLTQLERAVSQIARKVDEILERLQGRVTHTQAIEKTQTLPINQDSLNLEEVVNRYESFLRLEKGVVQQIRTLNKEVFVEICRALEPLGYRYDIFARRWIR